MKNIIPHSRPTIGKEEEDAAAEVIRSGHIAQGRKVLEFETALAEFNGVKGAVALNSGTSALQLGLTALGVSENDEVIVPSYVCSALLNAVYASGGRPVICDIDKESMNISVESIKDNITDRTKAVIVPHMFGNPADIERIIDTGVPIIEDCAHSIGAVYGSGKTGSFGEFSILSFYANKMMACGEGGAVLSNNNYILDIVRDLRDYDEKDSYRQRYNLKMSDIHASIGMVQLNKIDSFIDKRKKVAGYYNDMFSDTGLILPEGEFDHIYYRYVIRTAGEVSEIIRQMEADGVFCARPVYKPLHRYFEMRTGFRNTDEIYSTAVSIPIYPSISEEEKVKVAEAVKRYFL